MALIPRKELEKLQETHAHYCDFNQKERKDYKQMVALGHPGAKIYEHWRCFFDTLRYACNASARFYTFKNRSEWSQYWAPSLSVSWHPTDSLARFGQVYPAHEAWGTYLQEASKAAWVGAAPTIDLGTWHIKTSNPLLIDALHHLAAEYGKESILGSGDTYCVCAADNPAVNRAVIALMRKHHKGYVWRRPPQDGFEDEPALPLEQKTLVHANVTAVTVDARQVRVPLIPLSDAGAQLAKEVADELIWLVKQGFAWTQAGPWLKKMLTPTSYAEVERELTAAPAA